MFGEGARDDETISWLASLPVLDIDGTRNHGVHFTERGIRQIAPENDTDPYECHANMWTGSLYKIEGVRRVGLPDPDYFLDMGDVIYGYEGMIRGYKAYIVQLRGLN